MLDHQQRVSLTAAPIGAGGSEEADSWASSARTTHWLDGGTHHFPADRALGRQIVEAARWFEAALEAGRHHAHRTVEMLHGAGIRQFIDLGSGLPTGRADLPPTAASAEPDAVFIHVDSDPYVVEHGPGLLAGDRARHHFMRADLRDTLRIMREIPFHGLDMNRPVAFLLHNVLHEITDTADAAAIVRAVLHGTPPGSVLSLTHPADLVRDGSADAIAAAYAQAGLPVQWRTAEQIRDLALPPGSSWHLRAPGITPVSLYHPPQQQRHRPGQPGRRAGDPALGGGYAALLLHPDPA
ncbi:SAM-dependent methyltransferase [Streptomyces sp. NPDC092952]|uniref:SAM-dependent methyltransferase n=1 Tax=Streptomyces sp. NPDC092952 TaxID=3366018 RepID=UPI0038068D12